MKHNHVLWDGPVLVEQWPGKDMKGLDQITEGWSKVHGSRDSRKGGDGHRWSLDWPCARVDIRAAALTKGQSDSGVSSLRPALLVKVLRGQQLNRCSSPDDLAAQFVGRLCRIRVLRRN